MTPEQIKKHAEILSNRVKKRFRHLSRKFRKQDIDCFRLYDWDIPEVRAVVDWYSGHLVVAEYVRFQTGEEWLPEMAKAVARTLNIPPEQTFVKRRRTKTEDEPRYSKMDSRNQRFAVKERNLKFWVNLSDFLDTGLYSDHRDTRVMVSGLAKDKDFLNLFAYTGAFSCAAALGKAKTTTSVDRSATYIKWAKDNLKLNCLEGKNHCFVQSDTGKFLLNSFHDGKRFDLAFVDPPSFFQDRSGEVSFDINRDHPDLLSGVIRVMRPGGIILFSTNHQRFEPRLEGIPVNNLIEITEETIPEDYRNRQIHRLWRMEIK
ncbi:MAG: class I SAM-dependent methyltransferase [Candidatus Omnitrophica bacterium]|nr:class I SAM-dependent methyltransferase [Candidatus Omnitrophota bacterium]